MQKLAYLIVLIAACAPTWGLSQKVDEVAYLQNGWILRGEVDTLSAEATVVIKTRDGNQFVFPLHQLDSVGLEPMFIYGKPPFTYKPKGHGFFAQLTIPMSGGNNGNWVWGPVNLDLQLGYTYRLHHAFSVGAAGGFTLYNRGFISPVVLDVRGDLTPSKHTIFYFGQAGYGFRLYDLTEQWGGWQESPAITQQGGLYYAGGGGLKFHMLGGAALLLSVGYRVQHASETVAWSEQSQSTTRHIVRRLSLGVGVGF